MVYLACVRAALVKQLAETELTALLHVPTLLVTYKNHIAICEALQVAPCACAAALLTRET